MVSKAAKRNYARLWLLAKYEPAKTSTKHAYILKNAFSRDFSYLFPNDDPYYTEKTFTNIIREMGFEQSKEDPSMFMMKLKKED